MRPDDLLKELSVDQLFLLVVSQVTVPSFIAVNLSNDGYFLPQQPVETERHLLDFLNGVLDGSLEVSHAFRRRLDMFACF